MVSKPLWERRLADCKEPLFIYVLTHTFLKQLIEGDELYAKMNENIPPEDCEGWTIVLMTPFTADHEVTQQPCPPTAPSSS